MSKEIAGAGGVSLTSTFGVRYWIFDNPFLSDFKPVQNKITYGVQKDTFNKVDFKPVNTDALKIEITLQEKSSAGVIEVVIE